MDWGPLGEGTSLEIGGVARIGGRYFAIGGTGNAGYSSYPHSGPAIGYTSRRRDCHFDGALSISLLILRLKVEGGCSRMTARRRLGYNMYTLSADNLTGPFTPRPETFRLSGSSTIPSAPADPHDAYACAMLLPTLPLNGQVWTRTCSPFRPPPSPGEREVMHSLGAFVQDYDTGVTLVSNYIGPRNQRPSHAIAVDPY